MFLHMKNQYCENDYTTKPNLQIQCDPYQITNGIFHRTKTKDFTIRESESEVTQSCSTLCNPMDCSLPGSSVHGIFQASTGVGCHFLLQGIFLIQGSNLGLLHCRQFLYPLSHQGSRCMNLFELRFSLDICPRVGLLDHKVALFLVF